MEAPGIVEQFWLCSTGHSTGGSRSTCRVCGENRPCNQWIPAEGKKCGSREDVLMFAFGPRCPKHKGVYYSYYKTKHDA